jgi:hypothetical protein
MPRLIDLCSGRWGWSSEFARRGWDCEGFDLMESPSTPAGCLFRRFDILLLTVEDLRRGRFHFGVASTPCEEFSLFGMKHFHPNPPYPELGIKLFNHVRMLFEGAGIPYCMENVRSAQQFVGRAVHHCGPYFLWGTAVPPLMPQGIKKGLTSTAKEYYEARKIGQVAVNQLRKRYPHSYSGKGSKMRTELTAKAAMIPPELASCVADYADWLNTAHEKCARAQNCLKTRTDPPS